jgi:hypothetical protein
VTRQLLDDQATANDIAGILDGAIRMAERHRLASLAAAIRILHGPKGEGD